MASSRAGSSSNKRSLSSRHPIEDTPFLNHGSNDLTSLIQPCIIIPGREVIFEDLPEGVSFFFTISKWIPYLQFQENSYYDFVHSFYSNMVQTIDETLITMVQGRIITISSELINQILHTPDNGILMGANSRIPTFVQNSLLLLVNAISLKSVTDISEPILISNLCDTWLLILSIIRNNIIPTNENHDVISSQELNLLFYIYTKRQVDLGFLIFDQMRHISKSSKRVLPFGLVITRILRHFKISFPENSAHTRGIPIDKTSFPLRQTAPSSSSTDPSLSTLKSLHDDIHKLVNHHTMTLRKEIQFGIHGLIKIIESFHPPNDTSSAMITSMLDKYSNDWLKDRNSDSGNENE